MEKVAVTMIGTLPPIKGMSPYCQELVKSVSGHVEVEFIGFKKLYPDFLYPGGSIVKGKDSECDELENVTVKNTLTYYNPFSWIAAGMELKGDVVHAQWWSYPLAPVFFTVLLISKIRRKKVVITVHNVVPHERSMVSNFLNETVLFLGDEFIVHTGINKEKLSETYGIAKERIHVIPMGILTSAPIRGISRKKARAHLGISYNKKVVLFFGNIRDYKGLDVLIKSMKSVVEDIPEAMLLIAGQVWGEWDAYEKLIDELGLDKHIVKKLEFIQPSEVEYYFNATDIVVLPYKYFDSQSAIGALALPFKKPLIVTDVGGLPEFVKDKSAVAKPNDAEDLAERITCVLKDKNLILKLGRDSGDIREKFGWKGIAKKTIGVYRSVKVGRFMHSRQPLSRAE
ncbi:glycosyltransferase family 4 protein [Candidatus Micrarchaeota archaeon]|nr:glycosyltransferase family 4 protein [Candidatus Micrarchaeota archaeon]